MFHAGGAEEKASGNFFFFFSLAPQLVQFPVGCRDLSQNEIVSETCVKKKETRIRKEEKFYSTKRKCSHPCSGSVYFAMQQCADVGE